MNTIPLSHGERRLLKMKQDLVLQLYLREGPFWQAVNAIRTRWGVEPETRLPEPWPPALRLPAPEHPGRYVRSRRYFSRKLKLLDEVFPEQWHQFARELKCLRLDFGGRGRFWRATDWERFFVACLFYDPPEPTEEEPFALLAFAEIGGIKREGGTVARPVKQAPNPWQMLDQQAAFYEAVIAKLGSRYEEATGQSAGDTLGEILKEVSLPEALSGAETEVETVLTPDEFATKEEIGAAYDAVRSNPGGRRPINGLAAVSCAVLYDEHNPTNQYDGRSRLYTQSKLAKKFGTYGMKNERSAQEHLKRGRELRAARRKNL